MDSQYTFITADPVSVVITFPTPSDGDDSYGVNKVLLYGKQSAVVTGWKVYYKSIPRNGDEWPCGRDDQGNASPTVGEESEKTEGFYEAEVLCGANAQTKVLMLKHDNPNTFAVNEIRVAGLPSNKYDCDKGWQPGTQPCSRCPEGAKGVHEENKDPLCEQCLAGEFSQFQDDFEPILACNPCKAGHYSAAGSASCLECAEGTYQDSSGQSKCFQCAAGTYQDLKGKTECKKCSKGFYSPEGSRSCVPCPSGSVATAEGSDECTLCTPGSYQSDKGQASCLECKMGYYSENDGSDKCSPCKKGYYNSESGASSCSECAVGTFQSDEGQTTCMDCNMGTYNGLSGQAACHPCAAGKYVDRKQASECVDCLAGSYQDVTGSIDCKLCLPLQYQNESGAPNCNECEPGTRSEAGALECEACTAGTYLNTLTRQCVVCEAGFFSGDKALSCTPCDVMYYQDKKQQDTCIKCPEGSTSSDKGATACAACDRGTFRSEETTGTSCSPCSAGTFANETGTDKCQVCPAGSFSEVQAIVCEMCPKGSHQDVAGSSECKLCELGTYSGEEGQESCTPCPLDNVSSEIGSFSCITCSYGFYSPEVGGTKCLECPLRAAYQPPSCPPVIPNCPKLDIKNQYGNYKTEEEVEPTEGTPIKQEFECYYGLWSEVEGVEVETKNKFSLDCTTWKVASQRKSGWSTPSFAACGTLQSKAIYEETKKAQEAIKLAKENGKSLEETTVPEAEATSMLSNLFTAMGPTTPESNTDGDDSSPDGGDGDGNGGDSGADNGGNSNTNENSGEGGSSESSENSMGAADTANVVQTLAVVANSVPIEVLADEGNRNNILNTINDFAHQDDDFVQDAGSETANAAVNVVESIGASMFSPATEEDTEADPTEPTSDTSSKKKNAAKNDIKTDTMTIRPTPLNKKTREEPVELDFGDDEDEEDAETGTPSDGELPATEAPVIPEPAGDGAPAATAPPQLIMGTAKPPPIKKTVNVKMPPLDNVIKASETGETKNDAQGLVCVLFESSTLFPTKKEEANSAVAQNSQKKDQVASKVLLLSFGSKSISNINPPLELNFTKDEPPEDFDGEKQTVAYKCTYYDKKNQKWSSEGCETVAVDNKRGGNVGCKCTHMTSFAIMMSLEPIPDNLAAIQSAMSNPLLGFSLFCLLFMIATIMPFKALRSTRSMKIHLSLAGSQCFAISCFLLTNVPYEIQKSVPVLCQLIAVILDYAFLVVFMWTIVESVIMYISLVQVFGGHISKYMLKFNLFCWLTPLLSPLTNYFLTEGIVLDDGKCMVSLEIRQWTFILPVGVVLLINLFIFSSLVRVIANAANPDKSATENALKQLKAVASISILLGLGWLIAFFGTGALAPYIQIAFILINGTQGFFMFLFYCVGNEQYMDCWKMKFGMEVAKKGGSTMSSAAAAPRATQSRPAAAAKPAASSPATATPVSAPVVTPAVASPPPPKPGGGGAPRSGAATGRANRRGARQKEEPDEIMKEKDLEAETEDSSAFYENENVYDIIDDPDIKAITAANITRI